MEVNTVSVFPSDEENQKEHIHTSISILKGGTHTIDFGHVSLFLSRTQLLNLANDILTFLETELNDPATLHTND